MESILKRRSIRKYTDEDVSEALVKELLAAAMSAPSAWGRNPWHFVVIRDREILDKIPEFQEYAGMLRKAPVAIVVCGETEFPANDIEWVMGCSAAAENILLAAQEKGLGSVWLGIYPDESRIKGLKKLVGLPEGICPLNIVSLGWPAEEKEYVDRYEPDKVHFNKW